MKKLVFLGTVAVLALCLAGQVQRQAVQTPLTTAMRAVANAEDAKKEFLNQYNQLTEADARTLLVLYPWLAPTNLLSLIYSPAAETAGAGITTPTRSPAPVERLTITGFAVGPTSLVIRAEWPPDFGIPDGGLDLMGKLDLADQEAGWDYLTFVETDQPQGWLEREIPFDELSWYYRDGINFSQKAFFKFSTPEAPYWWWWDDWEEEGNPAPPGLLPPVPPPDANTVWLFSGPSSSASSTTESIPVTPGRTYLVSADCFDHEVLVFQKGGTPKNTLFTWGISVPGPGALTASTTTHQNIASVPADFASIDPRHFRPDFWLVTIPPGPGPASIAVSMSIQPDPVPAYYASGLVSMSARVLPLMLNQDNLPSATLQAPPGSTDNAGYCERYLAEGGTAFITGQPQPPHLTAHLADVNYLGSFNGLKVGWRLEVRTDRPDYRKTLDDRDLPPGGGHWSPSPPRDATHPNICDVTQELLGGEIIGGDCTLYCKVEDIANHAKTVEHAFPFSIKGMNPPDANVEAYAKFEMPAFCKDIALAILKHESRQKGPNGKYYYYNQFNAGDPPYYLPNKTADETKINPVTKLREIVRKFFGWGIGQIDRKEPPDDPSTTTYYVTTAEVWNWRTNVLASAQTFETKLDEYKGLLKRIKETYPNEWKDPPPTVDRHGVTWTHEQWGAMMLYNGCSAEYGVPATLVNAKDGTGRVKIYCPLVFDHKKRSWTFSDNKNNYAPQVAKYLLGKAEPAVE